MAGSTKMPFSFSFVHVTRRVEFAISLTNVIAGCFNAFPERPMQYRQYLRHRGRASARTVLAISHLTGRIGFVIEHLAIGVNVVTVGKVAFVCALGHVPYPSRADPKPPAATVAFGKHSLRYLTPNLSRSELTGST